MAKIFDRMKDLMFGEYEDDDDYYEDDYDTAAPAPAPVRENYGLRDARETEYSAPAPRKAASKNAANPQIYSVNTSVQMQVVIIKPECYEDAQEICDQIKTKRPVVVNLEKVEYPIAQRIMDFLSGTCYSLEGSIQRVANNIFIIAPENVDISGDFKEELKTKGVLLPWMNGTNARLRWFCGLNSIQTLLISAIGVFFYVLEILIFVRILFSWLLFGIGYNSSIGRLLYQLTEPILGPVRNMVDKSPLGGGMGLDFSPIFALILMRLVQTLLVAAIRMF